MSVVLLSVEATRNYIFNAVLKWQEEYFSIEHDESKDNISDINIYRPTYLPQNFIEISSSAIGEIIKITYEDKNGLRIYFQQSPSQSSHLLADHEDKKYSVISINGEDEYIFIATQDDKNNNVLWESNGVMFSITSEVESAELILIAES